MSWQLLAERRTVRSRLPAAFALDSHLLLSSLPAASFAARAHACRHATARRAPARHFPAARTCRRRHGARHRRVCSRRPACCCCPALTAARFSPPPRARRRPPLAAARSSPPGCPPRAHRRRPRCLRLRARCRHRAVTSRCARRGRPGRRVAARVQRRRAGAARRPRRQRAEARATTAGCAPASQRLHARRFPPSSPLGKLREKLRVFLCTSNAPNEFDSGNLLRANEGGHFVCEVGTSREKILRFRTVLGTPMLRASVLTTNMRLWGLPHRDGGCSGCFFRNSSTESATTVANCSALALEAAGCSAIWPRAASATRNARESAITSAQRSEPTLF
jgi:hypothetical protein